MIRLKPGYERISQHIEFLSHCPWLAASQKFWPRYLFHFTDVINAKNILTDGALFSRQRLLDSGKLKTDIASPEIIKGTQQKWKEYVRLYFRPRTPTQYSNEGIRPKDKLEYGAHCPIPVAFIFDAKEILKLQSTSFSDGNLGSRKVTVDDAVDFYLSLPFNEIYHDTGLSHLCERDKKSIIFHRHAEVIVPGKLDLSSLKYIICRSKAEYETLIQLLPGLKGLKWKDSISIDTCARFFFLEWIFVRKVHLSSSSVNFHFNPPSQDFYSFPFHARLEIEEIDTDKKYFWEQKDFKIEKDLSFDLESLRCPDHYKISFFLDDNLIYRNTYQELLEILF